MLSASALGRCAPRRVLSQVTNENESQSAPAKERGWLVRLYNDPMNKRTTSSRVCIAPT